MTTTNSASPRSCFEHDYSLTGVNADLAIEKGLAEADWYQCPVPRDKLRKLLERRNGPAIRDTILWFTLIFAFGLASFLLRKSWWFVFPYAIYAVLYASTSDSRWHESGHGTAFKSDWMNNALYEIASFMVLRESVVWRWSHTRHHSDTIIVGRDPEIAVPRPPNLMAIGMSFFHLKVYPKYFWGILQHSAGRMTAEEKAFIPSQEFPRIYRRARIYLAIYLATIAFSMMIGSALPALFIGAPNLFGSWLLVTYGLTQHAGLAENVLDHRLNCRTVRMNFVNRYLYWNMNYHVEHHMFPLVPYHALPSLHAMVKDDCPEPYPSLLAAWREIVSTLRRQVQDPAYHVKRRLPEVQKRRSDEILCSTGNADSEGWLDVCQAESLKQCDVVRFDHGRKTFAVYRDATGGLYATDGVCTHGNTHLSEGFLIDAMIECPKHNGRFNLADGSPARPPICRGLATYPVEERSGRLRINHLKPGGAGVRNAQQMQFRVVSNRSVATFIKELVLEQTNNTRKVVFTPGDYLQLEIPAYDEIKFRNFEIPEPYAKVWQNHHLFDLVVHNPMPGRKNNYSLASNQEIESTLRFNVRIATPPPGQDCAPGVGSSYVFNLKPGDTVSAVGPFGDFHIKPTQREMLYIGGGAGMAPMRAHLSHLLETEKCSRKLSFWYGARSRQEIFYEDYFENLNTLHHNFSFNLALSTPLPEDNWSGPIGFIHEVVFNQYLNHHPNPASIEFYLCGPPMMIKACIGMLEKVGVPRRQIAFDEF